MNAVLSTAGLLQEGLWVAKLERELDAKELESQTLSGLASKNSTLRAEVSRLRGSIEIFGRDKRRKMMLTQDVRDLLLRSKKLRAYVENPRKRNIELTGEVRE